MRLIRIKLSQSTPFWMLNPIHLDSSNPQSPWLDVDRLSIKAKETINKSAFLGEISIEDHEKSEIKSLKELVTTHGFTVDLNDIVEEEEVFPEVVSVTLEEEVKEEEIVISPEIYEEAKLILKKNGNTVRKIIKALSHTDETFSILSACLEMEQIDSNRNGIVKLLEQRLMEF